MCVCKKIISKNKGFTLVELMVTIAIAAIIMTLALPNFSQTITRNRLTTHINELVASLNFARSEAVKRNLTVTVRRSGSEWESGWNVFVDNDGDGTLDAGETVLRVHQALPTNYTLRTTGINRVTYQATGISGNSSFVLCDSSDGNTTPEAYTSKLMIINTVGRVRIGTDNDSDGIPEKADGTEITSCTVSPF